MKLIEKKIKKLGGIEFMRPLARKYNSNIDISNYLKSNNLNLETEWIEFLIKYGFGQFNDDIVFKSIDKIPVSYNDGTTPITFIYGWGFGSESLQETRDGLADQISSNYFVFAEGNPGDYLLINTVDGKIYYYSHEGEVNYSIFLVANTFEDFIESLSINKNSSAEDDLEEEWFSDDF